VSELLQKGIGRGTGQPDMLAKGGRLALFTRHPLPDLAATLGIGVDYQMLIGALGDLAIDPLAGVAIRDAGAMEDAKAALLGNWDKRVGAAIGVDVFGLT
jgi:hypothetical protein